MPRPGFELRSPLPFPTTITVTEAHFLETCNGRGSKENSNSVVSADVT